MKLKDYLYYSEDKVKLYNAYCMEILKKLPDNYIDLIVTDPPYGYSFMGKNWDKVVIPVSHWKECLRVLKPGAFAFVMSAPRQDVLSRMIINLREAGFETGFSSIYWSYATGFPKASNISKMADKRGAILPDDLRRFKRWFRKQIENSPKTQQQINRECGFTATSYYKTDNKDYWTSAFPTKEKWIKIKQVMGFSDKWDSLLRRYDKERGFIEPTGNLHQADKTKSIKFSGKQLSNNPYSKKAKELNGSYGGFQPKPAVEIIIVAMKPLSEKTYVDQALKNGKGITWLDDCRIPYKSEETPSIGGRHKIKGRRIGTGSEKYGFKSLENISANNKGRFPANLVVSDDILNDGKITKGQRGAVTGKEPSNYKDFNTHGDYRGQRKAMKPRGDSGSYSRYFDLDKWADTNNIPKENNYMDNQNSRKYKYNQNYFENINRQDKAYWLGFISGDGWIGYNPEKSDYRLQINLSINDIEHLAKFVYCLGGNPYEMIKIKDNEIATLVIGSKQIVKDLIKIGIPYKDKSYDLKPINLPEELMRYYWLGLFDADGCCGIYDKTTTYKNSIYQRKVFHTSLVGTEEICKSFSNYLGYSEQYIYPKARVYQFSKQTVQTEIVINIYQKLYNNFNLCLERKRKIFEEFLSIKQLNIEQLPPEVQKVFPYLIVPKASKSEKNKGCDKLSIPEYRWNKGGICQQIKGTKGNKHPTVKPLKLMSYLITLGSREKDIVLDPFVGSGTTGISAKLLNRKFIGIEMSKEYCNIAKARIKGSSK